MISRLLNPSTTDIALIRSGVRNRSSKTIRRARGDEDDERHEVGGGGRGGGGVHVCGDVFG